MNIRRTQLRRSGFTLLELTVAMLMVAILAMSLYASLQIAIHAKASAEAAVEPARTAELTMEFLRNDLQNAMPPTGVLAGAFEGTQGTDDRGYPDDDVNFYSTADGPHHTNGTGEIKNIELNVIVQPGNSDHVLVRRVIGNLLSQVQLTPDDEVICRNVVGFSVQYYTGSDWLTNWDSTQEDNTLPAAVQVTLDLQKADGGTYHTVRVFTLSGSTAASDSTVNTGSGLQ